MQSLRPVLALFASLALWFAVPGSLYGASLYVDADFNQDRDVDTDDFLTFSNCFNGALNPPQPGCAAPTADLDGDGDVDVNDFLTFSSCFNGSLVLPRCLPAPPDVQSVMHAANHTAGGYEVLVTFTGPLDDPSAQNPVNYRVNPASQGPTSATLSPDSLTVSLIFDVPLAISDTLDVSLGGGVLDAYGQPIAEQLGLAISADPADIDVPTAGASITAAKEVTVVFNEAMDRTSAETLANYRNVTDAANPIAASLGSDGQTVTLTFGAATDGDTVRVSEGGTVLDINGNAATQQEFVMEALQVAASSKLITPVTPLGTPLYNPARTVNHSHPVYLAGFGDNRPATSVHDELWARCIVLRFLGNTIAIVSLDVVGYGYQEIEEIRLLLNPAAGIDHLVVSSTHQHEGPDTIGLWGPDSATSGVDPDYIDFVNATVVQAVEEAAAALAPARVKIATANSAGLSMGIDPEDDGFGVADGKVLAGDDTVTGVPSNVSGRIVDPNIFIMQFVDIGTGSTLATLMNFGSHPESLGSSNTEITSDFPEYVRGQLESVLGGTAVYVSGDVGVLQGPLWIDVEDPNNPGTPVTRRTFPWADVHGTSLADRAISAIQAVADFSEFPVIDYRVAAPVDIPLANPYFRVAFAVGIVYPDRNLYTGGVVDNSIGVDPIFGAIGIALGEDVRTEVSALRIAEAGVVVVPSELDPQIGFLQYRALLTNAQHTAIIGLGNDELGYQLPAAKWDNGCHFCAYYDMAGAPTSCPGYYPPTPDCNTVFSNNVGPDMDPVISGALTGLLNDLNAGW